MTEIETRSALVASLLLLGAALLRALALPEPAPAGGLPVEQRSAADSLLARSDSAAAEEALRGRPLAPGERIDLNRASEVELDRLPGVGPALAARIVEERARSGRFRTPADLERVRGIGPVAMERLHPHVHTRP